MGVSSIEPMLLWAESRLPDGWLRELKLDGYHLALAARVPADVMAVTPTTIDLTNILTELTVLTPAPAERALSLKIATKGPSPSVLSLARPVKQ